MINYLALGDSYTIGESVPEKFRWPNLLSRQIRRETGIKVNTTIIAKTGWTTDELINAVESSETEPSYDLVSLLIGVNNQYRGYEVAQFRIEFEELLARSLDFASGNKEKVFVVSIPDYSVTPFAKNRDSDKITKEIDLYNGIAKAICDAYEIRFIDITAISRMASWDQTLIADDGLHPSRKMYQKWVEKVNPMVLEVLK